MPVGYPNSLNRDTEFTDAALQEPVNETHSQWFFTCNFIFRKDTYMTNSHPLTRLQKFRLLSLIPLYFMIAGLFLQPITEILPGLWTLIKEPDFLITDYFLVGGIGTSFINAGLLTLLCIWTIYFLDMEMDGHTITSSCLMFGFSLFGKNLLNIWAILFGVYLYSHYHKTHLSRYVYIGFYGTSLSPIITQIMYISHLPYAIRLITSLAVGLMIGFVLPPLSTHVHYAHKGYSLYNVGFSAGIIATVVVSVLKSFGITTESRLIWSEGNNQLLFAILCGLFAAMIIAAFLFGGKEVGESYRKILSCSGIGGTDYLRDNGGAATILNMAVNGLFATIFILGVGGELNGPTIGGIFTIVGFPPQENISGTSPRSCLASSSRASQNAGPLTPRHRCWHFYSQRHWRRLPGNSESSWGFSQVFFTPLSP